MSGDHDRLTGEAENHIHMRLEAGTMGRQPDDPALAETMGSGVDDGRLRFW